MARGFGSAFGHKARGMLMATEAARVAREIRGAHRRDGGFYPSRYCESVARELAGEFAEASAAVAYKGVWGLAYRMADASVLHVDGGGAARVVVGHADYAAARAAISAGAAISGGAG